MNKHIISYESVRRGLLMFSDSHWIKYHIGIAKLASIDAAILFGELVNLTAYWSNKDKVKRYIENGMAIKINSQFLSERTLLSRYRQNKALEELEKLNLLTCEYRKDYNKWCIINWDNVTNLMSKYYDNIIDRPELTENEKEEVNVEGVDFKRTLNPGLKKL